MNYTLSDFNQQAGMSTQEFLTDGQVQQQQMIHILCTKKRSRPGRPRFGCYIEKFLFDPVDEQSAFNIKTEIRRAFSDADNEVVGIELKGVDVLPDPVNQAHWVEIQYTNLINNAPEKLTFNLNKLSENSQ